MRFVQNETPYTSSNTNTNINGNTDIKANVNAKEQRKNEHVKINNGH